MDDSKKRIFYKALAFTFGILFFSLLFANLIYDWRKSNLDEAQIKISNESEDAKLFVNFYDIIASDSNSCELMNTQMEGLASEIYDLGSIINQYYEENKNIAEVMLLQKQQVYLNIEFWLRYISYNKTCHQDGDYILYFYPYNCKECAPLATEILNIRDKYKGKVRTFSLPAQINDVRMMTVLLEYYDVNYLPGVVVNGKTLLGLDSYKDIEKYLYK